MTPFRFPIERLIKLAGGRDMPTSEGMERARLAAHESWRRMLEQPAAPRRSRFKTMLGFATGGGSCRIRLSSCGPSVRCPRRPSSWRASRR